MENIFDSLKKQSEEEIKKGTMSNFKLRSNKGWSPNEVALLKFCIEKGLTHAQTAEVLERTTPAVSMRSADVKAFESGVHDFGKFTEEVIKKGLQLHFTVTTNALYLEQKQRWLDKIGRVNGISYKIDPQLEELREKKIEEGVVPDPEIVEEVEAQESTDNPIEDTEEQIGYGGESTRKESTVSPDASPNKPFFSFDLDVDGIVKIINALKGR